MLFSMGLTIQLTVFVSPLKAEQKNTGKGKEWVNFRMAQYKESVAFLKSQQAENKDFRGSLKDNSDLTQQQRQAALKDFRADQKTETKNFFTEQTAQNGAEFKQLFPQTQSENLLKPSSSGPNNSQKQMHNNPTLNTDFLPKQN